MLIRQPGIFIFPRLGQLYVHLFLRFIQEQRHIKFFGPNSFALISNSNPIADWADSSQQHPKYSILAVTKLLFSRSCWSLRGNILACELSNLSFDILLSSS